MKSLVNLSLSLVLAITPLFITLAVANQMMLTEGAGEKLDMDQPALWTATPTVVTDPHAYERIPGVTVPEAVIAAASKRNKTKQALAAAKAKSEMKSEILAETERTNTVDTAGLEACAARYRSYRAEDNSYQPFGGGAREQCTLRNDGAGVESASAAHSAGFAAAAVMSDAAPATDALFAHERWCQNRYSSYDPGSNTYQPFEGPRTTCSSPFN